ncbi:Ff.00g018510.m01.CDS01 [Fusarium sp. VM40]|nr:Ff.00g018510.m01.CDS01 [Fusarium sp. VM40]
MSRPLSQKIYSDVFKRWPKQALRPDHQLQDVLSKTVTERFQNYKPSMEREEIQKARALQFLLRDRFNDRFKLKGLLLEPKSQPTYFTDLVKEIDEAPNRSWFERLGKRLSGMIRFQ